MLCIGIGGNIGSGKTTVVQELIRLYEKDNISVNLIDADQTAWMLYLPGTKLYNKLLKQFGKDILTPDYQIDRKKLGQIVFNSQQKLNKLNQIIHPALINKIKTELCKKDGRVAIVDAALLFFWGNKIPVNVRILVTASTQQKIVRMKKRGYNAKEIKIRLSRQMNENDMEKSADFVVSNDSTIGKLKNKTKKLYKIFQMLYCKDTLV